MTILSKRILVNCGNCGALYTYPAEVPRAELECGGCGREPVTRGDTVLAILDENTLDSDPTYADVPKAVLNDGSRTPV